MKFEIIQPAQPPPPPSEYVLTLSCKEYRLLKDNIAGWYDTIPQRMAACGYYSPLTQKMVSEFLHDLYAALAKR